MVENPLEILGVPRRVVIDASTSGSSAIALKIAEGNYKNLAKVFHPDAVDGDAEYMATLARAIGELRDEDALQYYIDEIATSREEIKSRKVGEGISQSDRADAIHNLSQVFEYVDQYKSIGLDDSQEFFTSDAFGNVIVVQMDSEESSRTLCFSHYDLISVASNLVRFHENEWQTQPARGRVWRSLPIPTTIERVKVVGYVLDSELVDPLPSRKLGEIESSEISGDVKLNWFGAASAAKVLNSIRFGVLPFEAESKIPSQGFKLVLFKKDDEHDIDRPLGLRGPRFALTNTVLHRS